MTKTKIIKLYGIVQGVGMRPYVANLAASYGLRGTVCNKGSFVEIVVQGNVRDINAFIEEIKTDPPARAQISDMTVTEADCNPGFTRFQIADSENKKGRVYISPDIALCDDCRAELFDKKNRRYLHPFINCTLCGPRLSIIQNVPYDRERTTMSAFKMCEECENEYYDSKSRRFDAQPVCCNSCGPECYILEKDGSILLRGSEAISFFRRAIASGSIGAIKGIGGFHLCCDASNKAAVSRLRKLKHRPQKPFAVMAKNYDVLCREAKVENELQKSIICGPQKPIMLMDKKPEAKVSAEVAPENPRLGIMLPYAPLQELIFTYPDDILMPDVLVMTSANVSGAPIVRNDKDALEQISGFCDIILSHDREILTRADDSVMDFLDGTPYMIRRSRGYAPLPITISNGTGSVLGIGGELKNTFCLAKHNMLYPSAYLSDMEDARSVAALEETIERMQRLLDISPDTVCFDAHPRYNTTIVAKRQNANRYVSLQHHYAHILSCMAENDCDSKLLGLSFDGTGYGDDQTIWGGEILICDTHEYSRAGHISSFYQVGGDAASKEGWRNAVCILSDCEEKGLLDNAREIIQQLGLCDKNDADNIMKLSHNKMGGVYSTSAGRLFDAVSAMLGICSVSTYEGEAACRLEYAAAHTPHSYKDSWILPEEFTHRNNSDIIIPTDRLFAYLTKKRLEGAKIEELAYDFHAIMAKCAADISKMLCDANELDTVALSGGVFQNRLLTHLVKAKLEDYGLRVLLHSMVPPNDGGICLGQAYYALMNKGEV